MVHDDLNVSTVNLTNEMDESHYRSR